MDFANFSACPINNGDNYSCNKTLSLHQSLESNLSLDFEQVRTTQFLNNVKTVADNCQDKAKAKNNSYHRTNMSNSKVIQKGRRYTEPFKRKVLDYAVKHTLKDTAKKFNVNCNTLTEWTREYKRLLQLKKSTTERLGSKQKTDYSNNTVNKINETDDGSKRSGSTMFINWLRGQRLNGFQVGRDDVLSAGLDFLQNYSARNHAKIDESDWFSQWVRRLDGDNKFTKCSTEGRTRSTEKHIFYNDCFKLEVALYAKEHSKMKAAQVFGISSRRLYQWCSPDVVGGDDEDGITQIKHQVERELKLWYHQTLSHGVKPKGREIMAEARKLYAANGINHIKCSQGWLEKFQKRLQLKISHIHDEGLLMWILAQLDDNQSLSVMEVTQKAQQLATGKNFSNFKGTKGWTLRFLKRHSPLLQNWSPRLDLLPPSVVSQARSFSTAIQDRACAVGLSSSSIGCMDEVPITFNFPSEKVQTPRLLRQASLEACAAIIFLSATGDGRLLPPAVVFKRKNAQPVQQFFAQTIPVMYQENSNVDPAALKHWFQHVWTRVVKPPSVMVVDSYQPHQTDEFRRHLSTGHCHLAVIPPGCAAHLLPSAYNLSRRFQEAIQEEWYQHIEVNNLAATSREAGRYAPDENTILTWTLKAYHTLSTDTISIASSFHLTGLTSPDNGFHTV